MFHYHSDVKWYGKCSYSCAEFCKTVIMHKKVLGILGVLTFSLYIFLVVTTSSQAHNKTLRQHRFSGQHAAFFEPLNTSALDGKSSSLISEFVRRRRLPTCLIIGFSKCGTTALRGFLTLHPHIVSPLREIRYFTMNFGRGLLWYRNQMPLSTAAQITVEKSAGYINTPVSIERIHQMNAGVKLVVMVRDPITRLQSEYARCVSRNISRPRVPSFQVWCGGAADTSKVLRLIDYATPLDNVYRLFRRDQVLVLSEELLEEKPLDVLEEIEAFLNLRQAFSKTDLVYNKEKGFFCFNTSSTKYPKAKASIVLNEKTGCLGSHKGRVHPEIGDKFLKELITLIRPFNQRLFHLIGRTFTWANFKNQ